MTLESDHPETFVSLRSAAFRLGVPHAWLKQKVLAGEVPHLCVGRRRLVNPQAVEAVLLAWAQNAASQPTNNTIPPVTSDIERPAGIIQSQEQQLKSILT